MKKRTILLVIFCALVLGIVLMANQILKIQDCLNCRDDIEESYPYKVVSMPDTYELDCTKEYKQRISFPMVEPAYAVLHFDAFFAFPKRLTPANMQTILSVLNDSSSYEWGEFGTTYYDRFITFHDSTGRYIGITNIDFGGQANSYPHLARMKWGMLTDEAHHTIMLLIK